MMSSIKVTPAAENDLSNIWMYIADDNPVAADRVFEAVQSTFGSLLKKPKIGKVFESKRMKLKNIRFFPIGKYPKYVVYYREIDKGIEIIRVLHARMHEDNRLDC